MPLYLLKYYIPHSINDEWWAVFLPLVTCLFKIIIKIIIKLYNTVQCLYCYFPQLPPPHCTVSVCTCCIHLTYRKVCRQETQHLFKMWPNSSKILLLLLTVTSASQAHTNRSHHDGCIPEPVPGGATAAAAVLYEKSILSKQGEQGSSIIQYNPLDTPRYCQWIN